MSLRANVLAAIVTATAALVLALILLEGPLVDYRQTAHARTELRNIAERVYGALGANASIDPIADRVGAERAARVEVIRLGDGSVLGDTAGPPDVSTVALDTREIELARQAGDGWSVRPNALGEPSLFVAIVRGEYVIRVARPLATIEAARESIRELILAGGLISILAAVLLTYVITRTMVGPIERLTRTADALAKGDLSARARIDEDRQDEIARLGTALDTMAARLETQLEEARAGEERLRTMLDSMVVEAVFVTDRTGRIRITNRALEAMAATPANGRKVKEVIRNEHLRDAIRKAWRGIESSVEFAVVLQGRERALQAHVTPLLEEVGVVAVLHDVTDLKRADRIRRDFVANASHELRTPLTAIRGFAETLRDNPATPEEMADRFLDAILRHTHRLQRLVDDLLALSRAESEDQKFELGPVDVGPIVRDVASGLEAKGGQKGLEVTVEGVDGLPLARANAWALDHCVVNLVDNAVKYTPEGGRVYVRGSLTEAGALLLEVTDTGPGIAEEQRKRIFERFYRVDAGRTRTQGGTGLGLAIVKHLVSRMGGRIEVESELGTGTTFRLLLPLDNGPSLPPLEESSELPLPSLEDARVSQL